MTDTGTRTDFTQWLCCPACYGKLMQVSNRLTCTVCGTKYTIEDQIPNMVLEEAELPEGVTTVEELLARFGPEAKQTSL